jgi:hypothetical protein
VIDVVSCRALKLTAGLLRLKLNNLFSRKSLLCARGPVVSLTTYGQRLQTVYLTLEAIGRGKLRPSRLILWLDEGEVADLPSSIERLQERGLEVYYGEHLKSHKKYYHFVESAKQFDTPLVTADDDILYPESWLEGLDNAYKSRPDLINCYRAHRIKLVKSRIDSYASWPSCVGTKESYLNFATGVSGVIYPPKFLQFLQTSGKNFLNCCPKADDVWLHVSAIRAGYRIRQINLESMHFALIPNTQEIALMNSNLNGGNDAQISLTYHPEDVAVLVRESADQPS